MISSPTASITFEDLRQTEDEFLAVKHRFVESMPGAHVICITRCVKMRECAKWLDNVCLCVCMSMSSVHNRYQWQRYGQKRDMMLAVAAAQDRLGDIDTVVHEKKLWHGTSRTDPMVICKSKDGVDFRRVRSFAFVMMDFAHRGHCCCRRGLATRNLAQLTTVVARFLSLSVLLCFTDVGRTFRTRHLTAMRTLPLHRGMTALLASS